MQVVHLCVSSGWVGSLYNQQFSQPALSTGQPPTLLFVVYAYRRPGAVKRAERSVLVASVTLVLLRLLSLSSFLIPRAKHSVLVAAPLLAPPRSSGLLWATLREWLPSPPGGLPSIAPGSSSGLHPAPGVAPQPARGPAQ